MKVAESGARPRPRRPLAALPDHHPDPFDRLLIAQAQLEQLTIVTADSAFEDCDLTVLDARV